MADRNSLGYIIHHRNL